MRYVTYTEKERDIIKQGPDSIKKVLLDGDKTTKESLLFCLDYYLDPYYEATLPYESEVFDLLQIALLEPNTYEIQKDICDLLYNYTKNPLTILENNIDKLDKIDMETTTRNSIKLIISSHSIINKGFSEIKELLLNEVNDNIKIHLIIHLFKYVENDQIIFSYGDDIINLLQTILSETNNTELKESILEFLDFVKKPI